MPYSDNEQDPTPSVQGRHTPNNALSIWMLGN